MFPSKILAAAIFLWGGQASAQLHKLARAAGLEFFGTQVNDFRINDAAYMAAVQDTEEFGQLVPENGQKWQSLQPSLGTFTYSVGDRVR